MAKWRAARIVFRADVRLSIDTSISGGSAETWVADRPRNPAGPSAERAVTMVLPVARCPIARQNVPASMTLLLFAGAWPSMVNLSRPRHLVWL
jgi:hypothetical protein